MAHRGIGSLLLSRIPWGTSVSEGGKAPENFCKSFAARIARGPAATPKAAQLGPPKPVTVPTQ